MKIVSNNDSNILVQFCVETPKALVRLPHTQDFALICDKFCELTGSGAKADEIWQHLTYLRKTKRLPRKGR